MCSGQESVKVRVYSLPIKAPIFTVQSATRPPDTDTGRALEPSSLSLHSTGAIWLYTYSCQTSTRPSAAVVEEASWMDSAMIEMYRQRSVNCAKRVERGWSGKYALRNVIC